MLDRDVHRESIDQLEILIQLWKKIHNTITSSSREKSQFVESFNTIKFFTFRDEFLNRYDYPFSAEAFDAMDNLLSRLTHTSKSLEWHSIFRRIFSNTEMLENVGTTTQKLETLLEWSKQTSGEIRFYTVCFSLQLAMEGIYDEIVRFVYATEQVINGKQVNPDDLKYKRIDEIRPQIETTQKTIFDVWDEAHRIRNAIAHARFYFDQTDKKMRFVDVNPRDHTDIFSKTLSLEETQELVNKMAVIDAAFRNLFALLEIYGTLITPLDN